MRASEHDPRNTKLPPRILPLLYFGSAHVSLCVALFCAARWPGAVTGFFYHSWMVALVHLVTLGWITMSIFGATYIVGPVALRVSIPARPGDYVGFALLFIGLVGMVGHFWIEEFGGMAWSAATAGVGILYLTIRMAMALQRSRAPRAVTFHIQLAMINLVAAATAGVLLACDKVYHFLPGFVLSNVFAHAHLAALGWATLMVLGVGHRLWPMVLPAAPVRGWRVTLTPMILEAGIVTLFLGLVMRGRWVILGGIAITASLFLFLIQLAEMARQPRNPPPGSIGPNFAVWHAMSACAYLILSTIIGMVLLVVPASDWTLRLALVYGVFGLLGFLSHMILGFETRLLPMHAWYWCLADNDWAPVITPPASFGNKTLRLGVFLLWSWGVPVVATGFLMEWSLMVGVGAWALLAANLLAMADGALTVVSPLQVSRVPNGLIR